MSKRDHKDGSSYKKLEKGLKNLSTEEQDRIRSLLKNRDKKDTKEEEEKVEWIYKESKPEQEDYLLGRRVDRFVEQSSSRQVAVKDIPGSTFKVEDNELIAKRADMDMQAKMREDPLFAIRKREEEARKRLLENPVKMKQLQKIINIREAEKKKKEKKHKKHKKQKKTGKNSSDDDDDLVNKYLQILGKKHRLDDPEVKARLKKSVDDEDDDEGDDNRQRDVMDRHDKDRSDRHRHEDRHEDRRRHEDRHRDRMKDNHGNHRERGRTHRQNPESSDEESHNSSHQNDRHGDLRSQYGLVKTSRYTSPTRNKRQRSRSLQRRSRSPVRRRSPSPHRHDKHRRSKSPKREPPKKKLTTEEKERLRLEMMDDAKERDEQRVSNIKRYQEEDDRERQTQEKHSSTKAKFIKSMMTEHVSQSSVEDRIKRNKYNVQRTKAALENSFRKH